MFKNSFASIFANVFDTRNPFNVNKVGKLCFLGTTVSYRVAFNKQWEVNKFGEEDAEYTCIFHVGNNRIFSCPMDQDEIKTFHQIIDAEKKQQQDLSEIKEHLASIKPSMQSVEQACFESKTALGLVMDEYAITSSTSSKPIIGTIGEGPCLIIAIYDKSSETSFLTQIDASTDLKPFEHVIKQFNPETSDVHLYGRKIDSNDLCFLAVKTLRTLGFKINTAEINIPSVEPASLAIDARTGAIYTAVQAQQLEIEYNEMRSKIAAIYPRIGIFRKVYDGRKENSAQLQQTENAQAASSTLASSSLFSSQASSAPADNEDVFRPEYFGLDKVFGIYQVLETEFMYLFDLDMCLTPKDMFPR